VQIGGGGFKPNAYIYIFLYIYICVFSLAYHRRADCTMYARDGLNGVGCLASTRGTLITSMATWSAYVGRVSIFPCDTEGLDLIFTNEISHTS